MSHHLPAPLVVGLLATLACGCESGLPPERDCSGAVQLVVTEGDGAEVDEAGWALAGFATHDGGLAIRTIRIGGVPATTSGVGTVNWTVTLPASMVDGLRSSDDSSVDAEVTDSCGTMHVIGDIATPGEDAPTEQEEEEPAP